MSRRIWSGSSASNPDVNAIVQLRADQALAEARSADDADERDRGALEGVPVTIKDCYDVAGMVRSEGSASLADRRSPVDCVAPCPVCATRARS